MLRLAVAVGRELVARVRRSRPEAEVAIAKKRTPKLNWPLRLHWSGLQSF